MKEYEREILIHKIDEAKIVSFDIFDTLLFRKTNTPETVFDLVGKHFGVHGFRKLRMDEQNEASRRTYVLHQYPHADMDEIYEVLAEHTEIPVDWKVVKEYEIQMEKDALVANEEMLEIFHYAKEQGKRVVATSDMYLSANLLSEILCEKGFIGFDFVYCSADEHKAKFNRDLFELVAEKENVAYEDILHIGDKERDDGEYPASYGIQTFVYNRDADLQKVKNAAGSDVDLGLYKILYNQEKGFWYNLGVEVGGPIYMGLYQYLLKKVTKEKKKLFLLSRDGYNLYHIFKNQGYENVEYLYTSRRALTMASICEMNEKEIDSLPPYTYGQTVGEILDYLCVERETISHLDTVGFHSFDDIIQSDDDIDAFKKLYIYNKEIFLGRCEKERENAVKYFENIGFFDEDALCFDCGWQGSSQDLIERFKRAVGCEKKHYFVYFGIKNSEKSRKQLSGMHYETYLFDFYKNYSIQADLHQNVVMYELFFSAPHESVYYYGENGTVIFEDGNGSKEKNEILAGISDYICTGLSFVEDYNVEYTPENCIGHLKRLIHKPTEEEAVKIGNLQNVDGFARKQDEEKYIAYATMQWLECNANYEIYWPEGVLMRPDISEDVKKECALRFGLQYPKELPRYHLEAEADIRNYYRWQQHQEKSQKTEIGAYKPSFSVVIPVYNTVTEQLDECIQSILKQSYDNYELILIDDHSSWENVVPTLQKYETNDKVNVIYRSTNGHISVATNDGIAKATGEFIVFMDCDDVIEPNALYEFAKKLNENPELDFIYSDEDKLTEDGKIRHMPFFKPDWSPDLFMNMMYTNHLATYRTAIVKAVGGLRTAYNGSQDYDFTLRFMEKSDNKRVGHISKILYHWRERKESVAFAMSSKNYASEAARYAKEDYIRRNNLKAHLEYIDGMSQYRIVYEVIGEPLVSIIIPSKDQPAILKQCINSINEFTNYRNYEIIVVDNGSNQENKQIVQNYLRTVNAEYIYDIQDFNFSKMCNIGAMHAHGEYLLFLNDDIEMFYSEWLERMLGHAQQKHTGAVGAKLFYPNTTILQHAGVSNPIEGPLHSFSKLDDQNQYYFGWNRVDNNCICVTGACLLISADKFKEIKGFDEQLAVAYNDVKLCFALHEKGYYNVIRNDVVAYHHESLSRGSDQIDDEKLMRMYEEMSKLVGEFPALKGRDPYMNDNFHQWSVGLDLKQAYDQLVKVDLSGCKTIENAALDYVEVRDYVRVLGWSVLEGEDHVEELERFFVFRDPYGETYGCKAWTFSRTDVSQYFGNSAYVYAGLEAILRKCDLRVDIMPYEVGIMTIDSNQKKYLSWCGNTNVIRNQKPRPIAAGYQYLRSIEMHDVKQKVQWYLDECQHRESFHILRGFAFVKGRVHYKYQTVIILYNDMGEAYEFEVQSEERIDVAYTFAEEHFLYYTGFVCYIYDNILKRDKTYQLIIRLKNQFDKNDVYDIITGEKVIT